MIALDTKVVATKNQISTDMSDETVILNLQNGVYYGLDPVGTFIWKLIQEPNDVRAIRDAVLNEYDVEAERCEQDIVNLLQELLEQGLVEVQA
ncbi:MAG: lasso peptide biosynthesis PqqD family chaperone [Anaerolinea sp.]|nr:lasso peptide biosynthesis PqqD family chaperone [Anaerolinea sp.]